MRDAEYYTKKAESYDEKEYYSKKAQGYMHEAECYSRNQKLDKASTYTKLANEHQRKRGHR